MLVGVGILVVAAQAVRIPYPIFLVLGGLALGFVPGVPEIALPPDLVLVIFLPPLLYAAAFFTSLRDLRANLRPIGLLSVGLVLTTAVVVAAVAHAVVDGLPWAAAFALGGILAPTDPVAATSIAGRLGAPRRLVTVLEGESLINDGTALVVYRVAVAAVVTGSFSLLDAGGLFVVNGAGGVAIGVAVGVGVAALRARLEDPPTEIAVSLVTPYMAYLPAEALGVSGVLAAVTAGVWLGWRAPRLVSPTTRMQSYAVWENLTFLLNVALFVLVGLQLSPVLEALREFDAADLVLDAALICLAVIGARIAWVFPATYLPRLLVRRVRERDPYPDWRLPLLVSWTGMRGAVSLAAALALPLSTDAGAPFPQRDLLVFFTFGVILVTLVLQGLSLPFLIRRLGVRDDGSAENEELKARLRAAEAALRRIDELRDEAWVREDTATRVRGLYDYRRRRFLARFQPDEAELDYEERADDYQRLVRELLAAQRAEILLMRNEGRINDDVMRRVERDLDLEDERLELRPGQPA